MIEPPPTPAPAPWFTTGQRRLLAFAATSAAWLFLAWALFQLVLVLREFLARFGHVIWPLVIAGILSVLLRPLVSAFERRLRFSRIKAVILLYVLVVLACMAVGAIILPLLVSQVIGLAQAVPGFVIHAHKYFLGILKKYPDIHDAIKSYLERNNFNLDTFLSNLNPLLSSAGSTALGALQKALSTLGTLFTTAASLAVIPIYLFFLLDSDHDFIGDLRQQLTFLRSPLRYDIIFLVTEFVAIIMSFFRGQLLIGLILGILKAIGFTIIGLQGGLILGLIFGLLNVVPYLGTILGLATVLPIAYFQTPGGGFVLVLEAIAVFVIVQTCEGYFITPRIMGHRTGLHPMVIIISIFFWGEALNGILGMVLAVPLTAFLVVVWRLLRSKYLPRHGTGFTQPPHPLARHPKPPPAG
jgi:predicted PurR-regulated permease PerM